MNWKKLLLTGSVALSIIALPFAAAQAAPHGGRGGSGVSARGTVGSNSGRSFAGHGRFNGNGRYNGGRFGNGRWHHRGYWPRYYYSGYGGYYPFGFGYPYGFGYGYPYWGTSVYYNGYRSGYRNREGNVAVQIQRQLARGGYYRGSIDGVIGNGTRRAIRAYERDNGLPVDGQIDQDLLMTMGIS